jgi:hypothetical protein
MQEAADAALSGDAAAALPQTLASARATISVLMAIAVVNVALGVWRPRLRRS